MASSPNHFLLLGCSHKNTPLHIREKFSLVGENESLLYQKLLQHPEIHELLILNTCNRLEFYAAVESTNALHHLLHEYASFQSISPSFFQEYSYTYFDQDAIFHLFSVASGIDSQMLGESEILGQVKSTFASAQSNKFLGPLLNRIFQKSFQAAKWARSHTAIANGQITIGSVAAELATRIFDNLSSTRILILGSGEVGEKTLQALKNRGASLITVSNRTYENAYHLAQQFHASILPFDIFPAKLSEFDILIASTSSPDTLISHQLISNALSSRPHQPLFLIDLSVPRNICHSTSDLPNTYLYNLDDLALIANENLLSRQSEISRCQSILQEKSSYLWNLIKNRSFSPTPLPTSAHNLFDLPE